MTAKPDREEIGILAGQIVRDDLTGLNRLFAKNACHAAIQFNRQPRNKRLFYRQRAGAGPVEAGPGSGGSGQDPGGPGSGQTHPSSVRC